MDPKILLSRAAIIGILLEDQKIGAEIKWKDCRWNKDQVPDKEYSQNY